jgi:hypothetical protein
MRDVIVALAISVVSGEWTKHQVMIRIILAAIDTVSGGM